MEHQVELTTNSINKVLKKFTPEKAISEYIWNGFDASATEVNIKYEIGSEEFNTINSFSISDNGTGIPFDELAYKFKKFMDSPKRIKRNEDSDFYRGKNGYGRFTFFKFARIVKWNTVYFNKAKNINEKYTISMSSDNLQKYTTTEVIEANNQTIGTEVIFEDFSDSKLSKEFFSKIMIPYLIKEFAWYLELKEEFNIKINNEKLNYQSIIADSESFNYDYIIDNEKHSMQCKYLRWNQKINDEYSCFYFLNKKYEIKNQKTTLLNKKGDDFWHSIIIVDDFFNDIFIYETIENQPTLSSKEQKNIFKELIDKLNNYLSQKRRPFLRIQANKLIKKYKEDKVFPSFGQNDWDKIREENLIDFVKGLYEVQPKIFLHLNKDQQKILLELFNLIICVEERSSIFKILENTVQLNHEDREEFAKILTSTKLKDIIATIKLIEDRMLTIENLKRIVFEHELKAGEVKHLQKIIEKHYWIFGEQYNYICSEETKFEEALQKYIYLLRGESENITIDHPDKLREMDLFVCGRDFRNNCIENLVVEIKNPTNIKKLTNKEYTQIEDYIDVILKQDRFNDNNAQWTFLLIGQDYDDKIKRKIEDKKDNGLTMQGDNYKLYVKKWSEIINNLELRHTFILDKLKIERSELSKSTKIEDIMDEFENSAMLQNDQEIPF